MSEKDLFHGFYSYKQYKVVSDMILRNYPDNKGMKRYPCSYWMTTGGEKVKCTCVFNLKDHKNREDCKLYFDDFKYLGIVQKHLGGTN